MQTLVSGDHAAAIAAALTLATILAAVYVVVRATFKIMKWLFKGAEAAFLFTFLTMAIVVGIGLANR